jgi:hypothetical protein
MEYLGCYKDVRFPLGSGNALSEAFDRARSNPFPTEAGLVNDPAKKLLIALCFELQKSAGDQPFFAPTRDCGKLLNRHWNTITLWLNAFIVLGILKVVEKVDQKMRRSPRFRVIQKAK